MWISDNVEDKQRSTQPSSNTGRKYQLQTMNTNIGNWSQFCFKRSKTDNKAQHFLVETTLPRGFRNQLPFEVILPAALQKGPRGTHALPGFKRSYFDISAVTEKKQFHSKTLFFTAKQKDSYKNHAPADQIRCCCTKERTFTLYSIHLNPD